MSSSEVQTRAEPAAALGVPLVAVYAVPLLETNGVTNTVMPSSRQAFPRSFFGSPMGEKQTIGSPRRVAGHYFIFLFNHGSDRTGRIGRKGLKALLGCVCLLEDTALRPPFRCARSFSLVACSVLKLHPTAAATLNNLLSSPVALGKILKKVRNRRRRAREAGWSWRDCDGTNGDVCARTRLAHDRAAG